MQTLSSTSSFDSVRIRSRSGLAVFLLAAVLLTCGLHLVVQAGMRRIRGGAVGDFNLIADGRVNADLIISGSSRAVLHYDPDILEKATGLKAFNIGRIGARTYVHTGVLNFYLHHNLSPRMLIENADLNSMEVASDLYDLPQYTPYLSDDALYEALRLRYPRIWLARYLPLYGYVANDVEFRHYQGLQALRGVQPSEGYRKGFLPSRRTWTDAFARLKANRKALSYQSDSDGVRDFEAFLSAARSRGIPTVVVFSPVYYEHLAMVDGLNQIRASFAAVARKYNAEFWDFTDLEPVSRDTRYFFDSTHMNARGATVFSEVLGARLAARLGQHP
jgi:hypothetical protein